MMNKQIILKTLIYPIYSQINTSGQQRSKVKSSSKGRFPGRRMFGRKIFTVTTIAINHFLHANRKKKEQSWNPMFLIHSVSLRRSTKSNNFEEGTENASVVRESPRRTHLVTISRSHSFTRNLPLSDTERKELWAVFLGDRRWSAPPSPVAAT